MPLSVLHQQFAQQKSVTDIECFTCYTANIPIEVTNGKVKLHAYHHDMTFRHIGKWVCLSVSILLNIPPANSFQEVYKNHPICPCVQMSCKLNPLTDELILMKLVYTVAVYKLRICMKDDIPCLNCFKGDNLVLRDEGYPFVFNWIDAQFS